MQINYPYNFLLISKDNSVFTDLSCYSADDTTLQLDNLKQAPWYRSMFQAHFPVYRLEYTELKLYPGGSENIYFITSLVNGFDNMGLLVLGRNRRSISRMLEASFIARTSNIFLFDDRFNAIAESESNTLSAQEVAPKISELLRDSGISIPSVSFEGKRYFVFSRSFSFKEVGANLKLVALMSATSGQVPVRILRYLSIILVCFFICAVFVLIYFVNRWIVHPIILLNGKVKDVQAGRFDVRFTIDRQDEIGELSRNFSVMVENLNRYIQDIKREERQKRNLEIRILQSQINPHFVRNTLNTIRWMAEIRGAKGISSALMSFSKMLNYLINTASVLASVRDEIDYLEQYLYLQKIRYQNKLSFSFDIDEALFTLYIPRLLFLPIAENSIIHGIAPKKSTSEFSITGTRNGDTIVFAVRDTGVGMSEERLGEVESRLRTGIDQSSSIGLANTQKRIVRLFGDAYGLQIRSERYKGTEVTVMLPALSVPDIDF